MFNNITVFGSSHVGKSTLVGYIITYGTESEKFEYELEKLKKKIPDSLYDSSRYYGYFVDKAKSEIYRPKRNFSTSKQVHFANFQLNNNTMIIIDTPGFNKRQKEQYKGLFLADIGLFMIEVQKIKEVFEERKVTGKQSRYAFLINAYFSPLFLWKQTREYDDIIFVISKMDELKDENPEEFKMIVEEFFKELLETNSISIAFISIDVSKRKGYNIFPTKEYEDELNNNCLINLISKARQFKFSLSNQCHLEQNELINNSNFAVLDRKFEETKSNRKVAFRFKSLHNHFEVGDEVKFGPVRRIDEAKRGDVCFHICTAEIGSILIDGSNTVSNVLHENQIGGVSFSRLFISGDRIDPKNIRVTPTTIMTNEKTEIICGNFLDITLHLEDWASHNVNKFDFDDLRLNHTIFIHWAGRVLNTNLVGKRIINDKCHIQVLMEYGYLCLPVDFKIILPERNEVSILKRYETDKFIKEEGNDFKPVVFLKAYIDRVIELKECFIQFSINSRTDLNNLNEHLRNKHHIKHDFMLSEKAHNLYIGKMVSKADTIIEDIKRLSSIYKDTSEFYDKSDVDVFIY